jgi:hypothetical protein
MRALNENMRRYEGSSVRSDGQDRRATMSQATSSATKNDVPVVPGRLAYQPSLVKPAYSVKPNASNKR